MPEQGAGSRAASIQHWPAAVLTVRSTASTESPKGHSVIFQLLYETNTYSDSRGNIVGADDHGARARAAVEAQAHARDLGRVQVHGRGGVFRPEDMPAGVSRFRRHGRNVAVVSASTDTEGALQKASMSICEKSRRLCLQSAEALYNVENRGSRKHEGAHLKTLNGSRAVMKP